MRGREPSVRAVYANGQGLLGNQAVMPPTARGGSVVAFARGTPPTRAVAVAVDLRAWRRSGQQFLDRGLQVGQRLAIEPGAIGDPRHAWSRMPWTGLKGRGAVFRGRSIAPLPAAGSRSLPPVASHAIGCL